MLIFVAASQYTCIARLPFDYDQQYSGSQFIRRLKIMDRDLVGYSRLVLCGDTHFFSFRKDDAVLDLCFHFNVDFLWKRIY